MMTNTDNQQAGGAKKKGSKKTKAAKRTKPSSPLTLPNDAALQRLGSIDELRTALVAISDQLFVEEKEIAILTHAALAFCKVIKGQTHTFSAHNLADEININFPPIGDGDDVQESTLRRFIIRDTIHPERRQTITKLGAYIILKCLCDKSQTLRPSIAEALAWWPFVDKAKNRLQYYKPQTETRLAHDNYFANSIRGLRDIGGDPERIYFHFFGKQDSRDILAEYKEICYCLNYRYAVSPDNFQLVKTFISISTPSYNGHDAFEYRHIHLHKEPLPGEAHRETLRKARGVLLKVENNYYFVGGSGRQNQFGEFPVHAEGIQVISVEVEQFNHRAAGLIALFLTNDNKMRPMVGRSALIRLGTRKNIGRQNPEDFDLGVFDPKDLDRVVSEDLDRVGNRAVDKAETAMFIRNVINLKHLGLGEPEDSDMRKLLQRPIRADIDPKRVVQK
jgi:hypothetical protein